MSIRTEGVGLQKPRWLSNATTLAVAACIGLLIGECVVRWLAPQDLSGTWRVELDDGLLANRSEGVARHQFGNRTVRYRFAHPHLREPAGNSAKFRVLVLGDSFTFGWLVEAEDSFVGRWRRAAGEQFGTDCFSFHNASAGGWGTADQLAYAERFLGEVRPHLVVSVLNRYDIERALRTRLFDLTGDQPVRRPVPRRSAVKRIANSLPGYQWLLEHSHLVQLIRRTGVVYASSVREAHPVQGDHEATPVDAGMRALGERTGQMLYGRLIDLATDQSADFVVLTTGWPAAAEATAGFLQSAESWFSVRGVPFADVRGVIESKLMSTQVPMIIEGDTHPNEDGHRLIAATTWPALSEVLGQVVSDLGADSTTCRRQLVETNPSQEATIQ